MLLDLLQVAALAQRVFDGFTGFESVHARELAAGLGDHRSFVEDLDGGKPVPLGDLVVVGIVGRGHLDRSGPELGLDRLVRHDRDLAVHQG